VRVLNKFSSLRRSWKKLQRKISIFKNSWCKWDKATKWW